MKPTRYHNDFVDNAVCFWTSAIVGRVPILVSATAAKMIVELLGESRGRCSVKLLAYVVMPDHIHLAVWAENGKEVQRFLEQFLGITAGRMAALCQKAADSGNATTAAWLAVFQSHAGKGRTVRVWKERGRGFPVNDMDTLIQKINYIHENPVRAGLVSRPEDWVYSSASWYLNGAGPLPMDSVEL